MPWVCPLRLSTNYALLRSEEHTSELQSRVDLVCRLLLEKKKDEVVRLHGPLLPIHGADGHAPEVLLVVEHLGVAHVVDRVHPRLDPKQPLGVTEMGGEVG